MTLRGYIFLVEPNNIDNVPKVDQEEYVITLTYYVYVNKGWEERSFGGDKMDTTHIVVGDVSHRDGIIKLSQRDTEVKKRHN